MTCFEGIGSNTIPQGLEKHKVWGRRGVGSLGREMTDDGVFSQDTSRIEQAFTSSPVRPPQPPASAEGMVSSTHCCVRPALHTVPAILIPYCVVDKFVGTQRKQRPRLCLVLGYQTMLSTKRILRSGWNSSVQTLGLCTQDIQLTIIEIMDTSTLAYGAKTYTTPSVFLHSAVFLFSLPGRSNA